MFLLDYFCKLNEKNLEREHMKLICKTDVKQTSSFPVSLLILIPSTKIYSLSPYNDTGILKLIGSRMALQVKEHGIIYATNNILRLIQVILEWPEILD